MSSCKRNGWTAVHTDALKGARLMNRVDGWVGRQRIVSLTSPGAATMGCIQDERNLILGHVAFVYRIHDAIQRINGLMG